MREAPTKKLSRLLEAKGITHSYTAYDHGMVKWESGGLTWLAANAWPCNDWTRTRLVLHVEYPTPEQAVALSCGLHDKASELDEQNEKLRNLAQVQYQLAAAWCDYFNGDTTPEKMSDVLYLTLAADRLADELGIKLEKWDKSERTNDEHTASDNQVQAR